VQEKGVCWNREVVACGDYVETKGHVHGEVVACVLQCYVPRAVGLPVIVLHSSCAKQPAAHNNRTQTGRPKCKGMLDGAGMAYGGGSCICGRVGSAIQCGTLYPVITAM